MSVHTVQLRSKGQQEKGNLPMKEMILGPISHFLINFYIGYMGIIRPVPSKFLGAKFYCRYILHVQTLVLRQP